ncbi:MAG: polysaccharide deacetylase family protein, partial [Proteobacteria bacterium]|nr:polysaccharide deacetylase family protein [Pseudomonadota bacterium]
MTTWAVIVIPVILAGLGLSARYAFWRPDIPGVPALMYHYLADDPGRTALPKLRVAPRRFERQMDFLKSRGFRTLCCRDFVRYAGEGVSPPERSVMITFDDGARESLLRAAPVLAERGFCATVFVASDLVGEYNRWDEPKGEPRLDLLDWSELKSLAEAGWEI